MVDISVVKSFYGTPFSIETTPIQNGDGFWNSTKVSIFQNQDLIGEYIRNYPAYGDSTFFPFELDGNWFALYSASYTCTRIMKIDGNGIIDWCGEEPSNDGFCPVEFYVPKYYHYKDEILVDTVDDEIIKITYPKFGFLSGCYWGDDSTWKLRFINLEKVTEKVLEITERFGYWVLPNKPLGDCIQISTCPDEGTVVTLLKEESFRID